MHKLGRGQRDKVQQFIAISGTSEKVALQALKASDWHLEGAFDIFYSQPQIRTSTNYRHLEELYFRYKDPYVDMIMADGITLLCKDLQVDPQDIVMLVVSWHMNAATMCEFSRPEFMGGLQALGVDSLEKFRERIQFMRSELKDEQKFREIYNFSFGWAKEKGQKSLALDTAIGMWQLLFAEKKWPLVDHWCQFLQEWIMEHWEKNYYISAIAGANNGSSLVVMSKGTQYAQQSYKVSDSFPFKWINKKWREGFYVTSMATAGSRWAVVVSRSAGFSDQVVELDFLYPSEGIHRRWGSGYRITSTAATLDQAAFVLSVPKRKLVDETQETLRTSAFPSTHVKEKWAKNLYIASVCYGRTVS